MSQPISYNESHIERNVCLNEILSTPDDNDIGYFVEVDSRYPYIIKQKTKYFPFCPENKNINKDDFDDYMNKIKTKIFTEHRKLLCYWTDKKKLMIQYRMLEFYVRHGLINTKLQEIISFKQSKWLEKYITFDAQKRNVAKTEFKKISTN